MTTYTVAHLKMRLHEEISTETLCFVLSKPESLLMVVRRIGNSSTGKNFTVTTLFRMYSRTEIYVNVYK